MHIMEGYLPLEWCVIWYLIAIPFIVYGAHRIVRIVREHPEQKMTVALAGAFIFLISSLKLPSVTGSSSHPTGTGLSVVLYGISCTAFLSTIVLVFQALLLAHGGLTTLGANCFSMGIVGPAVGLAVWAVLRRLRASVPASMFGAAFTADLVTYVVTALQLTICYHASGYATALTDFLTTYAVTQVPLAFVEGVLFAMFAKYLVSTRPEIFAASPGGAAPPVTGRHTSNRRWYVLGFTIIAVLVAGTLVYGAYTGAGFGGSDDAGSGLIVKESGLSNFVPWFTGLWGSYELPAEMESLLFALMAAGGALVVGYYLGVNHGRRKEGPAEETAEEPPAGPAGKRRAGSGAAEQMSLDELAYSSRMVGWAPLGKLLLTVGLLLVGLATGSLIVPLITLAVGLALLAYSTGFRVPRVIGLAIGEALLIMVIGCGMISILGSHSEPALLTGHILWFDMYMTAASFNQAWLVFVRALAGVTLMLAFATSTPIPHLAQACRRLRLPDEVIELVVLIYRYSFLLLERMLVMWSAAKCRLGFRGTSRALRTTAGVLTGTFVFSLETAERAQDALACRGYRGSFPVYRMPRRTTWTWVLGVIALCALLFALGCASTGWLQPAQYLGGWA